MTSGPPPGADDGALTARAEAWLARKIASTRSVSETRPAQEEAAAAVEPAHTARLVFTGNGAEYLRIWSVNVLLTLLTLGIYSAWAKVRKARYFRNNTRLDGHVFDYHGRPAAILRGRLVAVILFAGYTWAFQFSLDAALITVVTLCAVAPWLFMRALQFSLSNTSHRGIRFGFHSRPLEAYGTALPVLVLWLLPSVIITLTDDLRAMLLALISLLATPWMHHRLKAYQRRHAAYGAQRFQFTPTTRRFYTAYAGASGLLVLIMIPVGFAAAFVTMLFNTMERPDLAGTGTAVVVGLAILGTYAVWWPFLTARVQRALCEATRLGDIRFHTDIAAGTLVGLMMKNTVLTVLTAGIYWPIGAVAAARYRIESIRVEADAPLSSLAAGMQAPAVSATGEGAADVFGFDIGV